MDLSGAWEQLAMLRETTRMTGALHEAQILQLKMWPRILIQDSTASSFSIDLSKKSISFKVSTSKKLKTEIPRSLAVKTLAEYTQKLLGDEWDVEVAVSGKNYSFPRKDDGQREAE